MKVAYILNTFPSVSETFILRELVALGGMDIDIHLFALRRGRSPAASERARELVPGVCYRASFSRGALVTCTLLAFLRCPFKIMALLARSIWHHMSSPMSALWLLRNFAVGVCFAREAEKKKIDHIHAHFLHIPADLAWLMSEITGIPFSVSAHAHDIYTLNEYCYEHVVENAQFLATCTNDGQSAVRDMFPHLDAGKVVTVRHGLFLKDHAVTSPEGKTVLCVGRLEPKKGFDNALRACALLCQRKEEFNCVIAGDGSLRASLEKQLSDAALHDHVHLAGELSQEEVSHLYHDAAMLVVPSVMCDDGDRDGLPNVILEAQACGLPVIATGVGGIPEFIEDGVNGFIVPAGNAEDMADRMIELLNDFPLRQKMGLAGRARVEEHFNIDKNIGALMALFEESRDWQEQ